EALPLVVLHAVAHESSERVAEQTRRMLIAGVAENPDGAAEVLDAAARHGVSERALAAIFHRGHNRVTGWRLYFVVRSLLGVDEVRLADLAASVAAEEPLVFDSADLVIRTAAGALKDGTLMIERE